jgi:hypothetical protein
MLVDGLADFLGHRHTVDLGDRLEFGGALLVDGRFQPPRI